MKSAWELALEKTGGKLEELSDEKKGKMAEIDAKYKAKIAEAELSAQQRIMKSMDDFAKVEEIKEGLTTEIASFKNKCEREKDAVRNG